MSTGYSRSPKLLKGALIEFSDRLIGPIPNIIVFQYNPETMTRTLTVWQQGGGGEGGANGASATASETAQPHDPPETFNLVLELDAADALEEPESHPVAVISGVADRIAAMEMLLYPNDESLLGGLLGSITGSLSVGASVGGSGIGGSISGAFGAIAGAGAKPVPRGTVPVLLFAWGPGRIVPVRLTSFSVEEQAYSPLLYPIRAKVSVGMKVLTPKDFPSCHRTLSQEMAIMAFKWTRKQKQVLAATNLANSVESILGMLPF
jgi:hypothetical protein